MGFFKDTKGNNSMARLVTFMAAISGIYEAALIPWSESEYILPAAIAFFTIAGGTKAVTKLTEAKNA